MPLPKLQEAVASFIDTIVADAQVVSGPYGYEPITPPDEETHWRIYDKDDNRVATCENEEHASLLVFLVNAGFHSDETATSDAPRGPYDWYTIVPTDGRSFCKIHDAEGVEVGICYQEENARFITVLMNRGRATLIVS